MNFSFAYDRMLAKMRWSSASSSLVCCRFVAAAALFGTRGARAS